jgi:hypothetical protein
LFILAKYCKMLRIAVKRREEVEEGGDKRRETP